MKKETSKKIMEKIKEEKISPDSKWKLSWKNYCFWSLLVLMIILGIIFLSFVILNVADFDMETYRQLRFRRFTGIMFSSLPYFWIILFLGTIVFGFLSFKKTKHGYRHNIIFIAGILLIAISSLAVASHFLKMNRVMEERFLEKIPHFQKLSPDREGRWLSPENGVLGGKIIEIKKNELVIQTPHGEKWNVRYSEKTKIKNRGELKPGKKVKIVGKKTGKFSFEAEMIAGLKFSKPHKNSLHHPDQKPLGMPMEEAKRFLPAEARM